MSRKLNPIAEELKASLPNQLVLSVEQLADAAGCSRSFIYDEVKAGNLRLNKLSRKSIVFVPEALNWLMGGTAYIELAE